jgi:hypothetical protein
MSDCDLEAHGFTRQEEMSARMSIAVPCVAG